MLRNIADLTLEEARKQLSEELSRQGVKELWGDSKLIFKYKTKNSGKLAVYFGDSSKRFEHVRIEDAFFDWENEYYIIFDGKSDNDLNNPKSLASRAHKYLLWKEGVWVDAN